MRLGSFRRRLVVGFVAVAATTALIVGVGAYAIAAVSLNERLIADSTRQAGFNIGTLSLELLPAEPTREDVESSRIAEAFLLRGGADTIVDFGDGDPYLSSLRLRAALPRLSAELRDVVARGDLGYQRITVDGEPFLVVGGRRPAVAAGEAAGPDFYFLFSAREVDRALEQLAIALIVGGVAAAILASLLGGLLARGVLRPVAEAGEAARRIAAGDLSARIHADSDDEFGAWARSFNRMAAALEEKVGQLQEAQARQRRFVSDVSHELRTPLTALVNEAALLAAHLDALPPSVRRAGELLTGDVARLRVLVDDLMELSRFDAEAERLETTDLDVAAFLRSVVAARAPDARISAPSGPVFVRTDQRRLERIVGNLLDNAREHGAGRGIEVTATHRDGRVAIEVADRGPGVPPADLPRLFDRFYKADPSRHVGSSGLGLAIARENAELLGGTLDAHLREGGGMAFRLALPVTPPLPNGDGEVTARQESALDRPPRPREPHR